MSQLASSVINRVPIEVWSEIFLNLRTSPPSTQNTYEEQELLRRTVLSVSQTCSRLRKITVGTPRLWTSIVVDFETPKPTHNLMMTKLWLDRSRGRPLSIALFHIPDLDWTVGATNECLLAIFSQVPRWKEAFLSWDTLDDHFWDSFDEIIGQPSLLESLTVDNNAARFKEHCIYQLGTSVPKKLWTESPRLQKVVMISPDTYIAEDEGYRLYPAIGLPQWVEQPFKTRVHRWPSYNLGPPGITWTLGYSDLYDIMPYSQLTHLRLDNAPGELWRRDELIRIFSSSPKLIACSITGILLFEQETGDKSVDPMILEHLRHLSLGCTDDEDFEFVSVSYALDYIIAPSLKTLTIVSDQHLCFDSYTDFIQRSSCLMEEINFLNTPFLINNLIPLLRLLPSLRAIYLHNIDYGRVISDYWDSEHSTEERYWMCPNLEQLSLSGPAFLSSARRFIDDVFDTWLHTPTGEPRTFRFLIPSIMDSQVQPELRDMCDEYPKFTMGFNDRMLIKGGIWDMYVDR